MGDALKAPHQGKIIHAFTVEDLWETLTAPQQGQRILVFIVEDDPRLLATGEAAKGDDLMLKKGLMVR